MIPERLLAALASHYRIERELGQGGMATVYLAHDLKHDRKVAIKVLREDLAASMGSARFLREIQIAAQLSHPNILPLLDSGDADGFLYYVMPYVPGPSLRERLAREGELPVHEAVRLLCEVTDALAESHKHGVVHRDIKPDNVMLSGRHALVTDFGVAKAISEATGRNTVTTLGVAVGTPTYMSPEQAAADPHIDHRSDIYAVGVMAYEMLSGRPPFTGATPQQVLAAHVTEAPDPVSKRRPAIPAALEQIVMRCLAKRPADRYQTAEELLQLLEAQATPSTGITPTQTRPVTAWSDPATRRSWLVPAVAVAVIAIGGAIAWRVAHRTGSSLAAIATQRQVTTAGTVEIAALSPDGQRVAYGERECSAASRCTYALIVQDVAGQGRLRAAEQLQSIYDVEWSGDGRSLRFTGTSNAGLFGDFLVPALGGAAPRYLSGSTTKFLGSGDSVMIAMLANPTHLTLRAAGALDLRNGQSIVIDRPGLAQVTWTPSPDRRWIAVAARSATNGRGYLVIFDRTGRAVDSIPSEKAVGGGWTDPQHFLIASVDTLSPGSLTIVEHALGTDGKVTGQVRTIVASQPMFRPMVSAGGVAFLAGQLNSAAYGMTRRTLTDTVPVTTELTGSTAGLGQLITGDGAAFVITRTSPGAGGKDVQRISLVPFGGGPERLLADGLRDVLDRSRTVAGDALVVLHREGIATRITRLDFATAAVAELGSIPDTSEITGLEVLRDGTLAWRRDDVMMSIQLRDPAGARREINTPGFTAEQLEDSPSGDGIAGWGWTYPAGDSLIVFHVAPGASTARRVVTIVVEGAPGLHWLTDGSIEIGLAETAATVALYRLDMKSGAMRRLMTLPRPFITGLSFSLDGLRMGARTNEPRRDAFVVRW